MADEWDRFRQSPEDAAASPSPPVVNVAPEWLRYNPVVPPQRNPFAPPEGTLQTIDDAIRAGSNAITVGMADRLIGAMPGTSTEEQVRLSEAARKRSPYA